MSSSCARGNYAGDLIEGDAIKKSKILFMHHGEEKEGLWPEVCLRSGGALERREALVGTVALCLLIARKRETLTMRGPGAAMTALVEGRRKGRAVVAGSAHGEGHGSYLFTSSGGGDSPV